MKPLALAALGVVAVCMLLAACGGSSASRAATGSSASSADSRNEDLLEFSKCVREHGVRNFPNPEVSEGRETLHMSGGPSDLGASPQVIEAANRSCQRYRSAVSPKLTAQERVAHEELARKWAKCMREHGVEVEVHTVEIHGNASRARLVSGKTGVPPPNPESPAFQRAVGICGGPKG